MDVSDAEAEISTVETVPAVVAEQSFSGVTVEEASQPAFEMAMEVAVAEKLGVEAGDVTITSTSANDDGSVVVQYTVTGSNENFPDTILALSHPYFTLFSPSIFPLHRHPYKETKEGIEDGRELIHGFRHCGWSSRRGLQEGGCVRS